MYVDVDELIGSVLVRLDESPTVMDDAVEYGSPDFDLRESVRELIVPVAEKVVLLADADEIAESVPLTGEPVRLSTGGSERVILPLPDDFHRFLYLRMSDWEMEVTAPVAIESASVSLFRLWAGRYGVGYGSAALALTRYGGGRALEIFGSAAGSTVADGGYLPRPAIDGGGLRFPPSLTGALADELARTINDIRG